VSSETVAAQEAPRLPGLPLLGNAMQLRLNPLQTLVKAHRDLGSVFQMSALHQRFLVLAGIEANQFLMRDRGEHLLVDSMFKAFAQELGTKSFLVAMDGSEHRHQRKELKSGFSAQTMEPHMPRLLRMVDEMIDRWRPGQDIRVLDQMQKLVANQLGLVLTQHPHAAEIDAIRTYGGTIFRVHMVKSHPQICLKLPGFLRAKRRLRQRAERLIDWHKKNPPGPRPNDLVDVLLNAKTSAGQPLPDDAVLAGVVDAHLVGIDTVASTCSFALALLAQHRSAASTIRAEAQHQLANGSMDGNFLHCLPKTHAACMETIRMYPVAPVSPRLVGKPFEFGGYRFETGTKVLIANAVTHLLHEFFPDPHHFDITRWQGSSRVAGAYSPYTLGEHVCLGAAMAELQMTMILARIMQRVTFAVCIQKIKVHTTPVPNPGFRMRLRVKRIVQTPLSRQTPRVSV